MSIEMNDKRAKPAALSTGAPAQQVADGDNVLVQPLTSYLEGKEHKNHDSPPYLVPRHHANELVGHGIARLVEAPAQDEADEEGDEDEGDEDQEDEGEEEGEEEPETEEPEDEAGEEAAAPAPRRRGRPRRA